MSLLEQIIKKDIFNAFVHPDVVQMEVNEHSPIEGKKIAVKDNIAIQDRPLTCASKILQNYISPFDATVIRRIRNSGVVILAHTNMDEFGMGSSCEYSMYGPVLNPFDRMRVAGGSSGGSAVAVATGMADLAFGSDTGGSVRQPAAFCGVYGYKPTYGALSRYGLVAFSSSMDQIGIMGKDIDDIRQLAILVSGADENDSTSLDCPDGEFIAEAPEELTRIRVGLPREYYPENLHTDVLEATKAAKSRLESMGADLVDVSMHHTQSVIPCYTILSMAEASSNLARYDGGCYGRRSEANSIEELFVRSRTEGFGPEVKRRLLLGSYILSKGKYTEYYEQAQKVRRLIQRDFTSLFENGIDLLLTPTTSTPAFIIGEIQSPLEMYYSDVFTASANLAGLPAINIPCLQGKLPVGVQLIAPPWKDSLLFDVAERMGELG